MRRNLYSKNVDTFIKALLNLGWKELTPNKILHEHDFTKGPFHLIVRKRKLGHYCHIHKNRIALEHHIKPITKGNELLSVYSEIMQEYRRIISVKHH